KTNCFTAFCLLPIIFMKPLVNLAKEPFQNRRLFWLAIGLIFAVPALLGLQAFRNISTLQSEIDRRATRVKDLEAQLKVIEKPGQSNINITPEKNRQLYAASQLRDLRAFSWSQLLNDIESGLTPAVRVLRVSVEQIQAQERVDKRDSKEAAATVMLEIVGKSRKDVTAMIDKFQGTGRFKVSPLSVKQIEGTDEVEYSLKVDYRPPQADKKPAPDDQSKQIAEKKK
ncbi:MAG: hypothetical protein J2P41_19435, partial [Blastocatellia bacterium]|nr:hypothetical protein [Blastocatellia bacterium]